MKILFYILQDTFKWNILFLEECKKHTLIQLANISKNSLSNPYLRFVWMGFFDGVCCYCCYFCSFKSVLTPGNFMDKSLQFSFWKWFAVTIFLSLNDWPMLILLALCLKKD